MISITNRIGFPQMGEGESTATLMSIFSFLAADLMNMSFSGPNNLHCPSGLGNIDMSSHYSPKTSSSGGEDRGTLIKLEEYGRFIKPIRSELDQLYLVDTYYMTLKIGFKLLTFCMIKKRRLFYLF